MDEESKRHDGIGLTKRRNPEVQNLQVNAVGDIGLKRPCVGAIRVIMNMELFQVPWRAEGGVWEFGGFCKAV